MAVDFRRLAIVLARVTGALTLLYAIVLRDLAADSAGLADAVIAAAVALLRPIPDRLLRDLPLVVRPGPAPGGGPG